MIPEINKDQSLNCDSRNFLKKHFRHWEDDIAGSYHMKRVPVAHFIANIH